MKTKIEEIEAGVNKIWESLGTKQQEFRNDLFVSVRHSIEDAKKASLSGQHSSVEDKAPTRLVGQ